MIGKKLNLKIKTVLIIIIHTYAFAVQTIANISAIF